MKFYQEYEDAKKKCSPEDQVLFHPMKGYYILKGKKPTSFLI